MGGDYEGAQAPPRAFLSLELQRLRRAFSIDPMLAMSVSRVDSLPHQIEAVYGHVLRKPRIRYMLAHDPGAGKTVMAGLVLKDLMMRGMIRRVLVVVPGQLREQWQWELRHRFGEDFGIVDRDVFSQKGGIGAWDGDLLITSIDFAKRDDVLRSIADARFDLVIVDEAHKMSAYSYGRATSKTRRYHLGEALSASSRHMLFLTATPHKGDSQNFRLLLDLLEPGFFSAAGMIEESVREGNSPVFLRRAKEDMVGFDGAPLFVPRTVYTPDVRLTKAEKSLYGAMSKYVAEQYNLATRSVKSHNITFALIILQRRFASSIYALTRSLKRRLDKLEYLEGAAEGVPLGDVAEDYVERVDEMSERDRWEEEQKWELISAAQNMEELRAEIEVISGLIQQAQQVLGSEAKLFQLKETLERLDGTYPDEKVLVFTESKDTLDYLVQHIRSWGYGVNTIHGSMGSHERKEAESVFRDDARVMVATEAAGEGINLQFCRLMINYDLPWNPNRLEQRMGRIHRYGQKLPVFIFNLVAADTREGEILVRLFEKLDDIRSVMGNDKVFDVISDIVPGKSLAQMMLDATVSSRRQKQIISELDDMVGDAAGIKEQMQDRFVAKRIDGARLGAMRDDVLEKGLVPEYARGLFCDIVREAGGSVLDGGDPEGRTVRIRLPQGLRPGGDGDDNDNDDDDEAYMTAVFDTDAHEQFPDAELVTFGHPAFGAALDWAADRFAERAAGGTAAARDPTGRLDGYLVLYAGSVSYGTGEHVSSHVVACMVSPKTGKARSVPPSVALDLDWLGGGGDSGAAAPAAGAADRAREAGAAEAERELGSYADAVAKYGRAQAAMAQKYGLRSLDSLLDAIEADVMRLLEKKMRGTKVDLAIYNKRKDRKKYREARRGLERRIESEADLRVGRASPIGVVRVIPGSAAEAARKRSALDAAMEFEAARGRAPENVSGEGRGFDIRSAAGRAGGGGGDTLYILALKEADGWVEFTYNEWLRAGMMHDRYRLYMVRSGMQEPVMLPDPAHALSPVRRGTMYRVSAEQVRKLSAAAGRS